jgi:hypothetical protein
MARSSIKGRASTYFFQLRFSGLRNEPLGLCAIDVPVAGRQQRSSMFLMLAALVNTAPA